MKIHRMAPNDTNIIWNLEFIIFVNDPAASLKTAEQFRALCYSSISPCREFNKGLLVPRTQAPQPCCRAGWKNLCDLRLVEMRPIAEARA